MLAGKDYRDLNDFRTMFEIPVQMERNKKSEELAEREKTYMQAQRYMRQSAPGGLNDAMSLTFT
jgi:UTP-glucose-1-phosphate uridylyltransferase